jgi:hypothetical protein
MSDDPRLYKIDLTHLNHCLVCPLPECGYIRHYLAPQCPIIWAEVTTKTEQKRRWLARKKNQPIQLVEA